MVFITAGMGGGTHRRGADHRQLRARTRHTDGGRGHQAVHFRSRHRMRLADAGIAELQRYVDTLIVIPNQNLSVSPTSARPSPRRSAWLIRCCILVCARSPT